MEKKKLVCFAICFVSAAIFFNSEAFSQNTTDPYSIYGIGRVDDKMYNYTSGMAGTGLALYSSNYLINNNPAGIVGLPRNCYVFNASVSGKTVSFAGSPINSNNSQSKDLWIKGISLSAKVNNFWASSFGFNQFSNINYKYVGNKQIEGSTTQYLISYQGDGGLNEYYWTNAISAGKHLMVGIKSSLIAGGIHQSEIIADDVLLTTIQSTQTDYMYHLRFEYGGIYHTLINKKWDFSLGGKFSSKTNFPAERTLTVIQNGSTIVNDSYVATKQYSLPTSSGLGIALGNINKRSRKNVFALDYVFDQWSATKMSGNNWAVIDNHKITAGYELTKLVSVNKEQFEKSSFQFGVYFNSGYLSVQNTPIRNYGFTIGTAGFYRELSYNLSLDAGQLGTTSNNLIRENYFQLTIGLSYRNFLLNRKVKYD